MCYHLIQLEPQKMFQLPNKPVRFQFSSNHLLLSLQFHLDLIKFYKYFFALFYNLAILTGGWQYKTLNSSNCCYILIRQSVCHLHSLPPQSVIYWQGQEPTITLQSRKGLHSGNLQPRLQLLDQCGSEWKWQTLQLITIGNNYYSKKFNGTSPRQGSVL